MALAMLVANQAVGAKVQELNASVGTVLTTRQPPQPPFPT
jgi:putative ABC transport system permease protein